MQVRSLHSWAHFPQKTKPQAQLKQHFTSVRAVRMFSLQQQPSLMDCHRVVWEFKANDAFLIKS